MLPFQRGLSRDAEKYAYFQPLNRLVRMRLLPHSPRIFLSTASSRTDMSIASVLAATWMEPEAAAIARGLRRRDPRLLDSLIEKYQHRLLRYLVYLTGNRQLAEDLFQETWVRVLERGAQYNGKSRFETWLFAIARHLLVDLSCRKLAQSLDALTDPHY